MMKAASKAICRLDGLRHAAVGCWFQQLVAETAKMHGAGGEEGFRDRAGGFDRQSDRQSDRQGGRNINRLGGVLYFLFSWSYLACLRGISYCFKSI